MMMMIPTRKRSRPFPPSTRRKKTTTKSNASSSSSSSSSVSRQECGRERSQRGHFFKRLCAKESVVLSPLFVFQLLHSHHRRYEYYSTRKKKTFGWRKDLDREDLLREDQEEDQRRERLMMIQRNIFTKGKRNVEDCSKR